MNYAIFPQKDTFIIEASSSVNAGIDEILEIDKKTTTTTNYNSRILMKFDLAEISKSIVDGLITSPTYYLKLWATEAKEIPAEYKIYAYPVSQSWDAGIGREDHNPVTTDGVSWKYRDGYSEGTNWYTGSSFNTGTTGSWSTVEGGTTWFTSSVTQSYSFESTDIRMNVTSLVNNWMNQSITNEGFILKRSLTDEQSTSELGTLQFFSSNTHTVYSPRLEVLWDDSSFVTGSLSEIGNDEEIVVYSQNLKKQYKEDSKAKIRISARSKYPTRTYSTSSAFSTVKYLPSSSYYEIRDAYTDEIIIPYDDDNTKLSCDSDGNYFKLWMNGLYAEQFYKLTYKVVRDTGSLIEYYENKTPFKIVK